MSQDCIFCKIVAGTIPAKKVFENERVLAFHDIEPQAPVHVLIVPKTHIPSMNEAVQADKHILGELALTAQTVAKELGIAKSGYRIVNNCGADAGQAVLHMHYHVLGGEKLGTLDAR